MYHHYPDFQSHPNSVGSPNYLPQYNRSLSNNPVVLDDYNSDLNFVISSDGCTGSSWHQDGFEYLWAGARATHGVKSGKACFEVRILEKLTAKMPETEQSPHVSRVGWSTDDSGLIVGEEKLSYGYGGTGKSSVNNRFLDYGEPYSVNDIITSYIDFDKKCIFFTKNGHYLGVAFELRDLPTGVAFYPHVTIKNMKVWINFGYYPPTFPPVEGFTMIEYIPRDLLVRGTCGPPTRRDCKVIMMVGLPGAGKTCWANEYKRGNKNLKINILGTNTIMDKMKVTGLARNRNYHGRWDQLIQQATKVLNKMLEIAEKKNRNYILDQTNVYPNARRRKMGRFHGFNRIAAVLVNTNEVLKERTEKREREEGKIVPESAVMEMKANFTLPEIGETFDDVWFLEENQENSTRLLEEFQLEGKIFKENERKNEELKRKRGNSPPNDDPPAKEPSRNNNSPRQSQPQPPHYPSAGYSPRDPRQTYGTPSFPIRSRLPIHPQHNNGVAGRYANYTAPSPPSGPYSNDNRQQPYSNNTYFYQDTTGFYSSVGYSPHSASHSATGYGENLSFSVQEQSLHPSCSLHESIRSDAGLNPRQPQEHDYRGGYSSHDPRYEGQQYGTSAARNQNFSSYPQYDGGYRY